MSATATATATCFTLLEKSTTALLDAAFKLKEHKEYYDHDDYLALLKTNGWKCGGSEEKRLLAIAETFKPFIHSIHKLAKIEPKTIYQLTNEKLSPVIAKLENMALDITQDLVVKFIRHQQNLMRKRKNEISRDGWKYRKNGRFYRVELIEEGDWTGMAIEQLRLGGKSVTEIIHQAMQLLVQQVGWKVDINEAIAFTGDENNNVESAVEPVQVTRGSIPTCFQPQIEDIQEKLFNELLNEFKTCQSWARIRNVLYCSNSTTRTAAWNELNQTEKQQVWSAMPEMVQILAISKKQGTIRDYREQLCGNKYEIYTWDEEAPIIVNSYMVERTLIEVKTRQTN